MVVYFRPLSSDDGAEAPLDLLDPQIRRYRFKSRLRVGHIAIEHMFVQWFGLSRPKFNESFTREELKRMLRWYFHDFARGGTERHTPEETELEELAEMVDSYLRNGPSVGEPTKLEVMAAAVALKESPSISTHPLLECPITLFAIPQDRWVEQHVTEERYWEVTPYHAAMLFEGAGDMLNPPGEFPPELEPYRDWRNVLKEVLNREDAESDSDSLYLNPYAPIREIDQPPLDEANGAATPLETAVTDGRALEAPTDRIKLPNVTRAPCIVEREAPSWNKETMTLSYKGKAKTFRKDAESVSAVFDWFQSADWRTVVKIQDYDVVGEIVHINNIVKRAREKANSLGFTITRDGETLRWADKSTLSDN